MRTKCLGLCLALGLPAWAGCARSLEGPYMDPQLQDRGVVIILPGIEGESAFNTRLREGLAEAGVPYALPIWPWGSQIPIVRLAMNEMDVQGNIVAGMRLAMWIASYQNQHPGCPVYLVGHSGGGGIAVFAAEALAHLPGRRTITGMVLLSPSVTASRDLTEALSACELGIACFYNESDVGLLWLGTTLMGNVDGGRGSSAGRTGFRPPAPGDGDAKKAAYRKVFQVDTTTGLMNILGAHMADTRSAFVRKYVAPWVQSDSWPPAKDVATR